MKFDRTTKLLNEKNEEIVIQGRPVLLSDYIEGALLADDPNDGQQHKKIERYRLWHKFISSETVALESDEVTLIKELVKHYQPIFIAGRVWDYLEGTVGGEHV